MEGKKKKKGQMAIEAVQAIPFHTTMRDMTRAFASNPYKFPKIQVDSYSSDAAGTTYGEKIVPKTESGPELEVLKAILNREGYLTRLQNCVGTINKKFKMEIAQLLDLIRAASLDVVETIINWREIKKDHDSAFIWNGINYLLKMVSDLDYLSEYRAIKKWLGFQITRNPFCIPEPMEIGLPQYAGHLFDVLARGNPQPYGYSTIGGMQPNTMKKYYGTTPIVLSATIMYGSLPGNTNEIKTSENDAKDITIATTILDETNRLPVRSPNPATGTVGGDINATATLPALELDHDMSLIRQAEIVMLKEEEKFGRHCRDQQGRIVPVLQALTERTEMELCKDDLRPLTEKSATVSHAPHAGNCDIGIAEEPWVPGPIWTSIFSKVDAITRHMDDSLQPRNRGQTKIGGHLAPLVTRCAESRERRPLIPSITSKMEFIKFRRIKATKDRLVEIQSIRGKILNGPLASLIETASKDQTKTKKPKRSGLASRRDKMSRKVSRRTSNLSMDSGSKISMSSDDESKTSNSKLSDLGVMPTNTKLGERDGSVSNSIASYTSLHSIVTLEASAPIKDEDTQKAIEDLKLLASEEKLSVDLLAWLGKKDEMITKLKYQERAQKSSEKSREIERKRRLLSEQAGRRKGPPPLEPPNIYDYFTTIMQTCVRGFLARRYTDRYRKAAGTAAVAIQARARGYICRNRRYHLNKKSAAALTIQRNYRGWKARGTSAALAKESGTTSATVLIQRMWRGVLGRRRCLGKRALDAAAQNIRGCVDPQMLTSADIKELAKRIQYAIEEPLTTKYPPKEVLELVRLVTLVMQGSRGMLGLVEYSFINTRSYQEVDAETMTWELAAKILNRSERYIRMIRTMAYAPSSKPPRIISVPNNVQLLYAAQLQNPNWNEETFRNMGIGANVCVNLFKWLSSMVEIAIRQQEFLSFLGSSFPDWLPKYTEFQRLIRLCQFRSALEGRSLTIMKEKRDAMSDSELVKPFILKEINATRKELTSIKEEMLELLKQQATLKTDQGKREEYALTAMEVKTHDMMRELRDISVKYQDTLRKANMGEKRALAEVAGLRAKVVLAQLNITEFDAQLKMLQVQCSQNEARRNEEKNLLPEIRAEAITAGEAKGLFTIASAATKAFMKNETAVYPEDLEPHKFRQYKVLKVEEEHYWNEYRKLFNIADSHRQRVDEAAVDAMHEMEQQEQQTNNKIQPSEADLREERLEDDAEAVQNRLKRRQFIPDFVLKVQKTRTKPALICLSRDLPAYCKQKILDQVMCSMPNLFEIVDSEHHMGLDLVRMQEILNKKKSIICHVDHGLTRISRTSFLKQLQLMVMSLVPCPSAVIAIGDDANKRMAFGDAHFGCSKQDIALMKDGDIKTAMEGMAWAIFELQQPPIQQALQSYCSMQRPPSIEFLLVAEALLVLQSEEDRFLGPDTIFQAQSWRIVQMFISQPSVLVESLKIIRRGKHSPKRVEVIACYLDHPLWPIHGSTVRQGNAPMHIMAYFIEQWLYCEGLTRERGGVPALPLSKGLFAHLDGVITVSDIGLRDPDDLFFSSLEHTVGWRMATAQLISAAASELMVYKAGRRINGVMYIVRVYREEAMVYIEAYDPNSSQVYMTVIKVTDIPKLLMPSPNPNAKAGYLHPPQTPYEMYVRLAELLEIKKVFFKPNSRYMLTIHRENVLMKKFITKIDGHLVEIKCYELVLGEMVIKAFVPEFSAFLEMTITEEIRLALYENGDSRYERDIAGSIDGPGLLPFVLDRLQLFPQNCMVRAYGGSMFGSYERKHPLIEQQRTQGLTLRVNCHHSLGKRIYRNIAYVSGVLHLFVFKSSTTTKLLRVTMYEPRAQLKMDLEVDAFLRRIITGTTEDDAHRWAPKLIQRIHRGCHEKPNVRLDLTLYKRVHKFLGRYWYGAVEALTEQKLKLIISDPNSLNRWTTSLPLETAIALINHFRLTQLMKRESVFKQRHRAALAAKKEEEKAAVKAAKAAEKAAAAAAKTARKARGNKDDGNSSPTKGKKSKSKKDQEALTYEFADVEGVRFISSLLPPSAVLEAFERYPYLQVPESTFDLINLETTMTTLLLDSKALRDLVSSLELILTEEQISSNETRLYGSIPDTMYGIALNQDLAYHKLKTKSAFFSATKTTSKSIGIVSRNKGRMNSLEALRDGLLHRNGQRLESLPSTTDLSTWDTIRKRRQPQCLDMEKELQQLAGHKKVMTANFHEITEQLHLHFMEIAEVSQRNQAIKIACLSSVASMLDLIDERAALRQMERSNPGFIKELKRRADRKLAKKLEREARNVSEYDLEMKQLADAKSKEIVASGEKEVYRAPARATFRDKKTRWHDQVVVTVYESMCWYAETGPGRRLRFSVLDPKSNRSYDGLIRNSKELADILGPHASDLLDKKKISEMVPFVVKFRMFVGKILYDEEGNLLDHHAPVNYRVEFDALPPAETDELGNVKVDLGDEAADKNKAKLKESEIARGKKLLRLTRRVTGLLLHLSFYEVAPEQDPSAESSKQSSRRNSKADHTLGHKRRNSSRRNSQLSQQQHSKGGDEGHNGGITGRRTSVASVSNRRASVMILDPVEENQTYDDSNRRSSKVVESGSFPQRASSGYVSTDGSGDHVSGEAAGTLDSHKSSNQQPPPLPLPAELLGVPQAKQGQSTRAMSVSSNGTSSNLGPGQPAPPLGRAISALSVGSINSATETQLPSAPGTAHTNPPTADLEASSRRDTIQSHGAEEDDGYGEKKLVARMPILTAPTIRVLAFEPTTKMKVNAIIPSAAIMEIVGGIYSPYLEPDNRRELAKIVADSLFLQFPYGQPFRIAIKWSGTMLETAEMVASLKNKNGWLTEGNKIPRIAGTIFRSWLRVNGMELNVIMYYPVEGAAVSQRLKSSKVPTETPLHIQFISSAAFDRPVVLKLTDQEQIERVECRIIDAKEGPIRTATVRRLIKFFKAHLEEDEMDPLKKNLIVSLMEAKFGFWTDFMDVSPPSIADTRPVGLPTVFMPLDRCGYLVNRRGMLIYNRNKRASQKYKDYLVSVYTKSETDFPDAGVIIKLYEQDTEETIVLHVGGQIVQDLCKDLGAGTLLKDIRDAMLQSREQKLDAMETELISLTEKGDLVTKYMKMLTKLCDILLQFISVYTDANDKTIPCLTWLSRGIQPA